MSTITLTIPDMYGSLFILGLIYVGYESYKAYLARKRTQEWYSFFRSMALYSTYLYVHNYPQLGWHEWWSRINRSRPRNSFTSRDSSRASMGTPGFTGSYSAGVESRAGNSNGTTTGHGNPGVYT